MNGAIFRARVEQMLAPEPRPGDIVIPPHASCTPSPPGLGSSACLRSMENLAAHEVDGIARAITDRGAELRYLPPHSRDPNPIEHASAKLEAPLRRVAERSVVGSVERDRPAPRPLPARRARQLPRQPRLSTLSVNLL